VYVYLQEKIIYYRANNIMLSLDLHDKFGNKHL